MLDMSFALSREFSENLPRYDLTTNTNRLTDSIRELGWRCINDLTVNLVGPAAKILDTRRNLRNILVQRHGVWLA